MARTNYSYNNKYLLTLTARWDGSSKLAPGYKWDFFPSAAIAWRASEEPFIRNLNVFSNLTFRFSYGEVGNNAVSPYSTQALVRAAPYNFGGNIIGSAPASLANSELGWEKSKEFNFGIDMGVLNNRIALTAELYDRKTEGLILGRAIPTSSGFNTITGNFAETQNRGIKLELNTRNISTRDFSWSTSINFSKNKNEILALAEDGLERMESSDQIYGTSGVYYNREYIVGEDILTHYFYEFDGIFQTGEESSALAQSMYGPAARAGLLKVKDQNNDGVITTDDKKVLGTETPSWTAGMTNTLKYKNFDFSFFLYTIQDLYVYDRGLHSFGSMHDYKLKRLAFIDYWTPSNPSNTWDSPASSNTNPYSWSKYFQNHSWVRLQNVTLGYSLPQSVLNRVGIDRIRVYATADNPLLFSDYKSGFDPEWTTHSSSRLGVSLATYLFGVNVTF